MLVIPKGYTFSFSYYESNANTLIINFLKIQPIVLKPDFKNKTDFVLYASNGIITNDNTCL